jgi:hypothetical protein
MTSDFRRASDIMAASDSRPKRSLLPRLPSEDGAALGKADRPDAAVLETLTLKLVAVDPLSVTELGETMQVASDGAPLQLKAIAAQTARRGGPRSFEGLSEQVQCGPHVFRSQPHPFEALRKAADL